MLADREWNRIVLSVDLSNFIHSYVNTHLCDKEKRQGILDYLEVQNGLKDVFKDCYDNQDNRFIEKYKTIFSGIHKLKNIPIASDNDTDTFNKVFMFLEIYRFNRDDFNNFNMLVDDLLSCKNCDKNLIYDQIGWNVIKKVIQNKDYKNLPALRRFFKEYMVSTGQKTLFSDSYYNDMLMMVNSVLTTSNEDGLEIANSIINYALDNYIKDEDPAAIGLNYNDFVLRSDRFYYLNYMLNKLEPNIYIRNEIFSRIMSLNDKMFNDMSTDGDAFFKSLDVVFDSDSYSELFNKLNILSNASSLYYVGKKKEAYEEAFLLNNMAPHLDLYNIPAKADTMIERMIELYSDIDKDVILNAHNNSRNILSLYKGIGRINDLLKKEEKNSFGESKSRIKK